ncbi:MAG: xanthine dehydrogenase family protein molybdopterin-binding subunit [Deltaproteobacteria bacterium]|nr:MAG: xanthine dehydrogenase family protein molybdopterin-binding subunit [Deltaproteobacteria bacterium]
MDKLEHGDELGHGEQTGESRGVTRRSFVGYLIAAPTLVAAADLAFDSAALAALPTVQPVDAFDLTDGLTLTTAPTSQLISVEIRSDGTVAFALPRAEVGQGITTAVAMTIADEMGMPLDKVQVTLADARPELVWNQITAGSNSMHSIFTPVRVAAAIARERLLEAAAVVLGQPVGNLSLVDGIIRSVTGQTVAVATVAGLAAVSQTVAVQATLKSPSQFTLIGTPRGRIDAHDIVTGAKLFAMDLDIPGALPTMLCRAPTINASAISVRNFAAVKAMPGITDVVIIPHTTFVPGGVAVRGQTFGHCITAIRALDVVWGPGTVDGKSEANVLADLRASELPMLPPLLGKVIEDTFVFHFRPGDPLETSCAVADVRSDRAEVWAALKTPIWCKEQLALHLGLPLDKVTVHVTQAGGSFGRHLFPDAAFEAAEVSRVLGKPVKLMWHRTDNFRQGRVHPMCTSHVRLVHLLGNVLTFDQRHTSVATDFSQGFGELLTALVAMVPGLNGLTYAQLIFSLTANVPYNFGVVTQLINEIYAFNTFNTSSVRNIYSPEVCSAKELIVDRAARSMGKDPLAFRREFVRDARLRAVLDQVASAGNWGRTMPAGTAQGIAIHKEYKGAAACLVEIDCRAATVNRRVPDAYTGPRVTKVVYAVDVGLPINPLGLEAQMMGGIMDGIAQALSYSLHLQNGHFVEGSWDNAYYTRQWNTPPSVQIIVMPPTGDSPGGAGEFGVAATMAAVACAYARATGTNPTRFPINHDLPLGFTPLPTVPSIPESPTDGLEKAF